MARPPKEGLDYFSHDTDAVNDEKIEALRALYGNDGYAFYFIMLERIYRTPDSRLKVSDAETRQILARKVDVDIDKFNKMLDTALNVGCFDKRLFHKTGQITSNGVQKRAKVVIDKRLKMKENYEKRKVSATETPQKPGQKVHKVKKSKVKHIKEYTPFFLNFWEIIPARNGKRLEKGPASKLFDALKVEDQELCIVAAGNYAASELVQKGIGIKDPKRFVRNGFWREWIEPETPFNPKDAEERAQKVKEYKRDISDYEGKAEGYRGALQGMTSDHPRHKDLTDKLADSNKAIIYYERKLKEIGG